MGDTDSEKRELNEADLNAVTGGSAVDTVIDVAKNVWNILTKAVPRSERRVNGPGPPRRDRLIVMT